MVTKSKSQSFGLVILLPSLLYSGVQERFKNIFPWKGAVLSFEYNSAFFGFSLQ